MLRSLFVAALIAACFVATGSAQSPSTTTAPAVSPSAKPVTKKAAPKAKTAAKQSAATDVGPCKLGVISAIGGEFAVQKFGITIFETEESEVPIEDWGLDGLVLARVRAATGADPAVRSIAYPRGAFEPFYHPKSRLLPDPREGLSAIVRSITTNANCQRYLVVTKFKGDLPGTRLTLNGIGTYNRGLGSLIRHSHLFANIAVDVLDGGTYEKVDRSLADFGTRLSQSVRITEDPLTKLDNSLFPEPPATASASVPLRERTRALVAAQLDQTLPNHLKD
jgi:hypothetical protein